jgi:predicted transcriptional regulator
MVTTIQIDETVKAKLDTLKIHRRESYNELISRLINSASPEMVSRDSLIETLEVLSDPEFIKGIERGIKDIEEGRIKPLSQVRKELE